MSVPDLATQVFSRGCRLGSPRVPDKLGAPAAVVLPSFPGTLPGARHGTGWTNHLIFLVYGSPPRANREKRRPARSTGRGFALLDRRDLSG